MLHGIKRYGKKISFLLALALCLSIVESVNATTISELQEEKKRNERELNSLNQQISGYKGAQADIGSQIEDLDAEIVGLITDINLIGEAIAAKEEQIELTQLDYDAALQTKNDQYESMKVRIKFMYEKGDATYLQLFTQSLSLGDMVNKAEYVEQLYEYDRNLLNEYQATVDQVAALQEALEEEKSELQVSKYELEEEQTYMEEVLAQKKKEYDNYDVMLAKARQEAAAYATKIKQETAQIKKLEEEERRRKEEEERRRKEEEERLKAEEASLAGENSDTDSKSGTESSNEGSSSQSTSSPPQSSGGSGKGKDIANYACQFVGNPYKAGGTSLTNGADCSGFVWAVYQHFGISLPRSSYAQSGVGKAVSYSEAQPGDIIYYGGHVGIYIGGGQIVHASTERTGIKIAPATYRSIITIRRVI